MPRSDNAEFLWRLARASRDLAKFRDISAEDKKRLTYEAFDYAKAALDRNEACFAAHKVTGACLQFPVFRMRWGVLYFLFNFSVPKQTIFSSLCLGRGHHSQSVFLTLKREQSVICGMNTRKH